MLDSLRRLEQLRGETAAAREPEFAVRLLALKRWQHARLGKTYADLSAAPRYAPAAAFFLDELYGEKDSAIRDRDLLRMYPTIKRLMPKFALETVGKAIELDVLSEEFDQALTEHLADSALDQISYARVFRLAGRREDRERQVVLMREVGTGLDRLVSKPFIYSALRMLRKPARAAGLGALQAFLEAGFAAFRHMEGAEYFLSTIARRESALIARLMASDPDPFRPIA